MFAGATNDLFAAEGKHYVTLWFEAEHEEVVEVAASGQRSCISAFLLASHVRNFQQLVLTLGCCIARQSNCRKCLIRS